ncbi:hypothetical protein GQ457_12G019490 [Hibiscus cannabinus]
MGLILAGNPEEKRRIREEQGAGKSGEKMERQKATGFFGILMVGLNRHLEEERERERESKVEMAKAGNLIPMRKNIGNVRIQQQERKRQAS